MEAPAPDRTLSVGEAGGIGADAAGAGPTGHVISHLLVGGGGHLPGLAMGILEGESSQVSGREMLCPTGNRLTTPFES